MTPGAPLDLLNPPRLDKKSVKKFFNRAAKSYDNAAILQEEVQNRLLERLEYIRHQPATVIDIGCGTGKGLKRLDKVYRRARVYGADIAHAMLLRTRSRQSWLSRQPLVTADMERLPFANDVFDLIYSSLALQWSNDLLTTFRELSPALLLFSLAVVPAVMEEFFFHFHLVWV